jgi:multidrug resistance protein, MATE family
MLASTAPAGPPPGLTALLILAWPVVLARSSQAVIGFCDALMTAPLGEAPLAAVTTGSINVFAITIMPMGLVFIGQSFASQLVGQGKPIVAVRYAWYGLMLAAVAGLAALPTLPFIGSFLGLLDYEPAVLGHMTDYLQIRALAVAAIVGVEALGNWYGGLGNTRLHMIAGLVMMVVNVALNWVLIGGNLGAPAMGVQGAALASVIASWSGFVVIALCFATAYGLPVKSARPVGLKLAEFGRMIRYGLPHGFNWFLEFAAFLLFINVVVVDLGTTVLAAMMVVFNINSVSFMPAFGLTTAGAILTGQAIGRGQTDEVWNVVKRTLTIVLIWQGSVGLLYLTRPAWLMQLFASGDYDTTELVAIGAVMLAISAAWQLFDAMAMTFGEALRSAGDTAWTLWARLAIAWAVFIPAGFISVKVLDGGHVAAMLCMVLYLALMGVVLMLRFRSGAWKKIDLTGTEHELL